MMWLCDVLLGIRCNKALPDMELRFLGNVATLDTANKCSCLVTNPLMPGLILLRHRIFPRWLLNYYVILREFLATQANLVTRVIISSHSAYAWCGLYGACGYVNHVVTFIVMYFAESDINAA